MKSIFGFDAMLTPKILVVMYWLGMVVILAAGLYSFSQTSPIFSILGALGGLIGCRMCFELIMIAFKNNEYLRRIAEKN